MPEVAQATITVTPVLEGAQQSLTDQMTQAASSAGSEAGTAAGKSMGQTIGEGMTSAGTALSKGVTAPIMAIGAAAVKSWKEVDTGLDTIVQKTGASGDALDGMHEILNNIATSIPTDFATAGAAIGEVNTRFGLTGQELEDLSAQFIKFADLNNTDVSSSIDSVQAAMAAFGLDASDASDVLDILNKAGQDTGVSMDSLAQDLLSNNAALQELGFGFNESAGFLANLNKNGVDSSTVMSGLKKALGSAAKEGKSMDEALAEMQDSIVNAADDTEAMQVAMELFGTRSGPAIAQALRDGRLSFDEFGNTVTDWSDSVSDTFDNTKGPMDDFQSTLNNLKIAGTELVEAAGPALSDFLSSVTDGIEKLTDKWNGLSPEMQETIIKVAGIAAAVGPLLAIGGTVIGGISKIAGGIGGLIGNLGGLGGAASAASGPVSAAGGAIAGAAASALKMIAAAAALYIAAQAISVLADAAIRITEAGAPAIAVLAGMAVGIGVLMGVAAALGPALTAGALGIAAFGAAMLMTGGGVYLMTSGIAKVTEAVTGLVQVIVDNSESINSIVSNIGDTVNGTISTITDGITDIIDAISGGLSDVLDSVAGIFESMGKAALDAGTGFEKLAGAVKDLVNNTSVFDLGATLGAVAGGVKDINKAADGSSDAAKKVDTLTASFKPLTTEIGTTSKAFTQFSTNTRTTMTAASASIKAANLAGSIKTAIGGANAAAASGLASLKSKFSNTKFSLKQHIAVPHFSMSGSFNAETGSVPHVSVSGWWAKAAEYGAIFSTPTIIGVGDAPQPELLIGEQKLKELISGGKPTNHNYYIYDADNPMAVADAIVSRINLKARTV